MGRIVKHVFSKPSRLRREGRGPLWTTLLKWSKKMNGQYIGMESIIGPYFDSFSGGSYFRKPTGLPGISVEAKATERKLAWNS